VIYRYFAQDIQLLDFAFRNLIAGSQFGNMKHFVSARPLSDAIARPFDEISPKIAILKRSDLTSEALWLLLSFATAVLSWNFRIE
jgi:hypothetical protein